MGRYEQVKETIDAARQKVQEQRCPAEHRNTRLAVKHYEGFSRPVRQCTDCGKFIKTVSKLEGGDISRLPVFDEDLRERNTQTYLARLKPIREQGQIELRAAWFADYAEYLASPAWRAKRAKILLRDGGRCRVCAAPATQVHHLTYERRGNELDEDLLSICDSCHEDEHPHMRSER